MDNEKDVPLSTAQQLPTGETASSGYVLDTEKLGEASVGLKTASNGHTVLIPQPSDDRNDPLNWPSWKKHAVLLTISFISFTPDFGT